MGRGLVLSFFCNALLTLTNQPTLLTKKKMEKYLTESLWLAINES